MILAIDGVPAFDRVAFSIFGIDIYWYAVLITVGMILGVTVAMILAKRRGVIPDDLLDVLLFTIPIGIIGARLYYVLFAWDETWTFAQIFHMRDGGLAIYGAVLAGGITAFIVARKKRFTLKTMIRIFDCLVVGVILGQAIGRWGNFINQEAFGNLITNPSLQFFPYGVLVSGNWYQATFFYESAWNVLGFIMLFIFAYKRPKIYGVTASSYLIYYGIGRFWIEGLRSDSLYFLKNILGEVIRVSQVLSLLLIALGVVALVFAIKFNKSHPILDSDPIKSPKKVETSESENDKVE